MKFGDNLKRLRKTKKLSQEDLAEKMKVSRQSISKWETGDAYPTMNNILELCKIFRCRMNDLVNDNITDASSLDEEVKKNVIKLKQDQQKKMKGLSKAIATIAKVCRMILMACVPIIVIAMVLLGIAIGKVEVVDNELKINHGDNSINIVHTNEELTLKVHNVTIANATSEEKVALITEMFENHSKFMITTYVELGLTFLLIDLVLISAMLHALENLFRNINKGDTPFTLENVRYIKKMAYLMIIITILPNIIGMMLEMLLHESLNIDIELFSFIEILFLFSIAYIFQYGYEIQLDSKGIMYGDTNE